MNRACTAQQQSQEREYYFPYHYLDLIPKFAYLARIEQSYRRIVRDLIGPGRGQSVLDAGCGDGRFCYDLRGQGLGLMGADYSEQALAFARAFCPDTEFVLADLTQLRLGRKFDVVVMLEVLEHLLPDMAPKVLASLHSCLAEGGSMIITVPSTREKMPPKHYRHFTPELLADTIAPHFEIVRLIGHLRTGAGYSMFKAFLKGDYVMGPLRTRFGFVRPYYWAIERLLRSIETCPPDRAARLIAVCRKGNPSGGGAMDNAGAAGENVPQNPGPMNQNCH